MRQLQTVQTVFVWMAGLKHGDRIGAQGNLKDSFNDLKETVIEAIKSMLISQVIEAGIKWLLSLLIPGAGFIKTIISRCDSIKKRERKVTLDNWSLSVPNRSVASLLRGVCNNAHSRDYGSDPCFGSRKYSRCWIGAQETSNGSCLIHRNGRR